MCRRPARPPQQPSTRHNESSRCAVCTQPRTAFTTVRPARSPRYAAPLLGSTNTFPPVARTPYTAIFSGCNTSTSEIVPL